VVPPRRRHTPHFSDDAIIIQSGQASDIQSNDSLNFDLRPQNWLGAEQPRSNELPPTKIIKKKKQQGPFLNCTTP
jgi:hypothetical protein